ncbi:MAG: N4-gp56 family major capsid protein [Negativicutes bacterium]|nr:N4-gp56 family major capsid protein [Negativicutes bacterium]
MALTAIRVNTDLIQKGWAKDLWYSTLKELYFAKFIGESADNIIQKKTDLKKEKGDRIYIPLMARLIAPGVDDDNTLDGNEEPMAFYDFYVTVHQKRHAVRLQGEFDEQSSQLNLRRDAKVGLTQWMQEYMDQLIFTNMSASPTANRVVYGGGRTSLNAVQAGDVMTAALISKAKRKALMAGMPVSLSTSGGTVSTTASSNVITGAGTNFTNDFQVGDLITVGAQSGYITSIASTTSLTVNNIWLTTNAGAAYTAVRYVGARSKLRPIKINGHNMFVMVIHPWQERDLRNDSDWLQAQTGNAAWREWDNPIFKGGIGVYDNVIVHTHENVALSTNTGSVQCGSALLMGAQAGCIAVAKEPWWREDPLKDYQNEVGFATGLIWGAAKSTFNNEDFGTVTLQTSCVSD